MSDKNYKSFKDYIEKRTVADIMSDYTEQKDEWEELPLAKTDKKAMQIPKRKTPTHDGFNFIISLFCALQLRRPLRTKI